MSNLLRDVMLPSFIFFSNNRYDFEATDQDLQDMRNLFGGNMTLPENFEPTAPTLHEASKTPADTVRFRLLGIMMSS
jgi:hypothetical protein